MKLLKYACSHERTISADIDSDTFTVADGTVSGSRPIVGFGINLDRESEHVGVKYITYYHKLCHYKINE